MSTVPSTWVPQAMRPLHRIGHAGLDDAGALQELLSVESERDAVGMPVEQLPAELGFKRLDRRGHGGLRHIERCSRGRKLSGFGGGDEVADLTEVRAISKSDISEHFSSFTIARRNATNQALFSWRMEKRIRWLPVQPELPQPVRPHAERCARSMPDPRSMMALSLPAISP
ncbi:hypothetical protein QUH67_22185 [Bradyrhizobium roseum]|nr:hypothetical protein [Bradyrhizobium roseus]WKA26308.1 hypothetical protein QUH67_22185 [Bradyrhizobium roseus]